jgi:Fungal specific transcription factor domain
MELSLFLGSAAIRISQNMGMHRESSGAELSSHECQERRRVFWVAYILDKK